MNYETPQSPREELEARLTALLLGELPDAEAAALREVIQHDAALAALHDRLSRTIALVRETAATSEQPSAAPPAPLKLSDSRRQKLLQHFKTVAPKEFQRPRRRMVTLLEFGIAAAIVAIVGAMLLPALSKSKMRSQSLNLAYNASREADSVSRKSLPEREDQIPSQKDHSGPTPPPVSAPPPPQKTPIFLPSVAKSDEFEVAPAAPPAQSTPPGSFPLPTDVPNSASVVPAPQTASKGVELAWAEPSQQAASPGSSNNRFYGRYAYVPSTTQTPSAGREIVDPATGLVIPSGGKLTTAAGETVDPATGLPIPIDALAENKPTAAVSPSVPITYADASDVNQALETFKRAPSSEVAAKNKWQYDNGNRGIALPHGEATQPGTQLTAGFSGMSGGGGGGGVGGAATFARGTQSQANFKNDGISGYNVSKNNPQDVQSYGAIALPPAQSELALADGSISHTWAAVVSGVTNAMSFGFATGETKKNDEGGKVPSLGDIPVLGAMFRSKASDDASKDRAPDQLGRQAGEAGTNEVYSLSIVGYANVPAPPGYTFQSNPFTNINSDSAPSSSPAATAGATAPGAAHSPIVLPPVPSNAGTELAYYTAGPRPAAAPSEASQTGSLSTEPDKKAKAAADADYLSAAPGIREAEVKTSPSAAPAQVPASVATATAASDRKNQPYLEAKRDLDELQKFQKVLDEKITREKIDNSLPKTTMVEIVDKAEPPPAHSQNLWDGLRRTVTGKVEAKARLKLERDQSDITGFTARAVSDAYDPYFVQTEFESLQSDAVLGRVVKDLNLNDKWGRKEGAGQPLETKDSIKLLKKSLDLRTVPNTSLIEVGVKSENGEEAAKIANAVAKAYQEQRLEQRKELTSGGIASLEERVKEQDKKVELAQAKVDRLKATVEPAKQEDVPAPRKPASSTPADEPQPEVQSSDQAFSTFSLNVSDVSFKLAAASLEKGVLPEPASVRSEEFINAFDYRDPEPPPGVPVAFAWERARYPFAQNRDLLRFSIKTAAQGRQPGRPLNLVLLLDTSGSMERADRVRIIHEALRVLAAQLQPQDKFSVVTFARTARLWVDGVPGNEAARIVEEAGSITPQGGTNLEEAMKLAYQTALRHYLASGINRVVLLTDGAANLGNVDPEALKQKVEAHRKQGISLDCFGIGWEGYNDDLLEVLTRNGDGRYGFLNTPEEAADGFAGQLAGALHVAAADVKVQVEFNPRRVTAYRQIGYAKHQLTKEQFRDNTVAAAQIGAAESGNALYVIAVNPLGDGPLGTVRVRYKVPDTGEVHEHEWTAPYLGNAVPLEEASPAMRLAASASAFSEWLASSPYAADVTPDRLLGYLRGVPEICGADARPKKLEWMIRQAKSIAGK